MQTKKKDGDISLIKITYNEPNPMKVFLLFFFINSLDFYCTYFNLYLKSDYCRPLEIIKNKPDSNLKFIEYTTDK